MFSLAPFSLAVILALTLATPLHAEDMYAKEIMRRAFTAWYYPGEDQTGEVSIDISYPDRTRQHEQFHFFSIRSGDVFKTVVYLDQPSQVAGTVFLMWREVFGEGKRWVYNPRSEKAVPFEFSKTGDGFLGARFVDENVFGRNLGQGECHMVDAPIWGHYWIRCEPQDALVDGYQYYYAMVRKGDLLPVKFEYMDADNRLVRLIEVKYVKQIQGFSTIMEVLDRNLVTGEDAVMKFYNVRYNIGLTDQQFVAETLGSGDFARKPRGGR